MYDPTEDIKDKECRYCGTLITEEKEYCSHDCAIADLK